MPEGEGPVVVDTTPLLALAILDRLELFRGLYGDVLVPEAVSAEIRAGGASGAGAGAVARARWVRSTALSAASRGLLIADLHRGEAEVLALAIERSAKLVVIDERLARNHAKRLGLALTGTVGILLRAKERGLLAEVASPLRTLVGRGFYLAPQLVARALELAGERA